MPPSTAPDYRRFGGKKYEFLGSSHGPNKTFGTRSAKASAKARARSFKQSRANRGSKVSVRTVRLKDGRYAIYWRSK